MNLPIAILTIRWMFRDTLRQALASGVFWLMLCVSLVCTLFCFSAGIQGDPVSLERTGELTEFLPRHGSSGSDLDKAARSGVDVVRGELTLGFGAVRMPLGRDAEAAVHLLQLLLAGGVADALGVLLALVWTAGFLPTFLEPSAATVLLSKPVPRWSILAGKYGGVLAFVGFQAIVFVGGTWLALGLRTGVWTPAYLLCVPLLILHFAIFFSCSVFLAVCTRSTVACVFGSVLFWLLCWGLNYGHHAALATPQLQSVAPAFQGMVDVVYWILPKPADLSMVLFDALQADNSFSRLFDYQTLQSLGAFSPELSVLSSLVFTLVMLAASARQLATTEY
ncbi:MAG TPA: ABC transporter permease subunit [Gemmataceae bacterium]|nr:ABC transporter permease subunit [Gemmataceae bacterium]